MHNLSTYIANLESYSVKNCNILVIEIPVFFKKVVRVKSTVGEDLVSYKK